MNLEQIEALERLAELKRQGILTDAEVETEKNRILAAGPPPPPPPPPDAGPPVGAPDKGSSPMAMQWRPPPPPPPDAGPPAGRLGGGSSPMANWRRPPPPPPPENRRFLIGALALVAIVVVVVVTLSGRDTNPSDRTNDSKAAKVDVKGTFKIFSMDDYGDMSEGRSCYSQSGFQDINSSTPVVIKDRNGREFARSRIGDGTIEGPSCVWRFTLQGVPNNVDGDVYLVTLGTGRRGEMDYSFATLMNEGIQISLMTS